MSSNSPPVPMALDNFMSDEVMKRRLLIDGDGGGDDRRIVGLMKTFLSCCSEDATEDRATLHKKLLNQISQVEHGILKTQFGITANKEVAQMYVDLDAQVKEEIERVRAEIENSKRQLELAKEHRKHQQEYNALATLIRTQPDRKETEMKRQRLDNELQALQNKQKSLDVNLDHKKRSMQVLISAITRLDEMLNEEEQGTRAMEEAERLAAEEKSIKSALSPVKSTPMEVDDTNSRNTPVPSSNPGSPLEQITPDGLSSGQDSRPAGVISSVPVSPMDSSKEKYDDLSESE